MVKDLEIFFLMVTTAVLGFNVTSTLFEKFTGSNVTSCFPSGRSLKSAKIL